MTKKTQKTVALEPYPLTLRVKTTMKPMGDVVASTILMSDGEIITKFDLNRSKSELHSAAIHESVHVCQFVQDFVQTKFDIETEAYFIEEVATKILSILGLH